MQVKQFSSKAQKFSALQTLAIAIQSGTPAQALAQLETLAGQKKGCGGFLKKKLERSKGLPRAHFCRANRAKASHQKSYKNDTQKFTVVRKSHGHEVV